MDENLRETLDHMDAMQDELRRLIAKWDQVCFAICEEAEDNQSSDDLPALMMDAFTQGREVQKGVDMMTAILTDLSKELFR